MTKPANKQCQTALADNRRARHLISSNLGGDIAAWARRRRFRSGTVHMMLHRWAHRLGAETPPGGISKAIAAAIREDLPSEVLAQLSNPARRGKGHRRAQPTGPHPTLESPCTTPCTTATSSEQSK